jgi:signal transduction histidine kinase
MIDMKDRIAIKVALIYFLAGFLWILFSDRFILSLGGSANATTVLQTYKGWFFIITTAIILFFLIRKEIRKENKIEEELSRAKLKAEESDLLKSAFLTNISHEIRTPLNGILGFGELLLDDSYSTDDKLIFAKNLSKNGHDLLKLINDILDISKIQEHQFEIARQKFNLNNLLDVIYYEYEQSEIKQMRTQVSFKLVKGSPNSEIELYSDPVRLMLIFQNLLNNAFFYTTEGYVHFGYKNTDSGIELFVEDSGCGIDDSNKDLIFKPFFKGKTLVVGSKGFGLGLAISKGLAELLGSNLQFTSTMNKGSRFYFEIDNSNLIGKMPSSYRLNKNDLKIKSIFLDSINKKHMQN